jgi:23S rRNA (adenine2503-C2)-methyltransferase
LNQSPNIPVLTGIPLEELVSLLALPPYKARQVFAWISRGVENFDLMTDLGKLEREDLFRRFALRSTTVSVRLEDPDGTVKLHIALRDGAAAEAVLLVDGAGRKTACISTQAGCPLGCIFCKTGSLGFLRNLDAGEIVEQFFHLKEAAGGAGKDGGELSNIVIMGMGEPLLNLGELRRALAILMDPQGLGIGKRRITVSTSGVVRGIMDLADHGPPLRLALSLTSAREPLRNSLMPIGRDNPLPRLKEALLYYQQKTGQRITLEAVLLKGLNTGEDEARAFRGFAQGLDAVVNLIPWNPVPGLSFQGRPLEEPSPRETESFARLLEQQGLNVTRRLRKGRGVGGACGQLGYSLGRS